MEVCGGQTHAIVRFGLKLARPFLRTVVREPLSVLPVTLPYYLRGGPAEVLRCVRSAQSDFP